MSISKLFAILIAVSMLFAPFATQSGGAMAAMPTDHHGQMKGMDHCEGQASDNGSKSADKPCCAAMCAPVAIAANFPVGPTIPARAVGHPALELFRHGILAKLPTPPPRLA